MPPIQVVYVLSEIDRALSFEWTTELLDPARFQLRFILLNRGPSHMETYLQGRGIEVVRLRLAGKGSLLLALARMWWLLRLWKPDIVHCHLFDACRLGLPAAWAAGVRRRIYTRHHSSLHHRYHKKGVWFDRVCNRLATQIVATCGCVHTVLAEWEQVPSKKLVDIYCGFRWSEFREPDPEVVRKSRRECDLEDRYPVVGGVGRFVDWKGFQFLVPGFRSILKDYPEAVLVFPGDHGPFRAQIEALLKDIPERNYRIIPHQASPGALFNLFDIFVHVPIDAHIEAFGQIYIEALACGVPSVFTLSGVAPEVARDGENCLIVPFQDADAVGAALRRLLSDSALMQRLRDRGYPSVKDKFSLENHIAALKALYQLS